MEKFFAPNIGKAGRIFRGAMGVLLLAAGVLGGRYSWWVGGPVAFSGLVGLFEAWRGWCLMRACGVRTKF